jgi:mRNA interferase MazF
LVARGDVWWVEHPASGRRPYLVLTRETAISALNRVIAVPATRTVRGIVTEVPLDTDDGMPTECVLSLDNVRLMPKEFFRERITKLSGERMTEICRALAIATGCD